MIVAAPVRGYSLLLREIAELSGLVRTGEHGS
jgi:hypothetical protein